MIRIKLAFHPYRSNILLSGSTDALINIYDTNVADEDDALIHITNHSSSIHHASFLSDNIFFGLSHDEIFSLYHFDPTQQSGEEAEPSGDLALGDLREVLHCEYIVDAVKEGNGNRAIIAAGSCRSVQTPFSSFPTSIAIVFHYSSYPSLSQQPISRSRTHRIHSRSSRQAR